MGYLWVHLSEFLPGVWNIEMESSVACFIIDVKPGKLISMFIVDIKTVSMTFSPFF